MIQFILVKQLGTLLCLIFIVIEIYREYFKPLKNYEDFIKRSINYELLFKRKKSIETLEYALELNELSKTQRYGLLLSIGKKYYNLKNYTKSADYFNKAFKLVLNEPITYEKCYLKALKSFKYVGEEKIAIELYYNFLERQYYDESFKNIRKVSKLLGVK